MKTNNLLSEEFNELACTDPIAKSVLMQLNNQISPFLIIESLCKLIREQHNTIEDLAEKKPFQTIIQTDFNKLLPDLQEQILMLYFTPIYQEFNDQYGRWNNINKHEFDIMGNSERTRIIYEKKPKP